MAVNVDQAGDHSGTRQVDGVFRNIFGQDRAETAVLYLKGAGMELKISGQNSGIFIKHGHSPSKKWNMNITDNKGSAETDAALVDSINGLRAGWQQPRTVPHDGSSHQER